MGAESTSMPAPLQDVRTEVRREVQQSIEQTRVQQAETRERIREAIEHARQMEAAQGGHGGGNVNVHVPPPPGRIQVLPDGRIIVDGQPRGEAVTTVPTRDPHGMPLSEQTIRDIAMGFFMMVAFIAVALPLIRLFSRMLDRRHAPVAAMPSEFGQRLDRIEQAVEAVAIEVERISEGQRFTSRLMSELRGAPQLERVTEQRG